MRADRFASQDWERLRHDLRFNQARHAEEFARRYSRGWPDERQVPITLRDMTPDERLDVHYGAKPPHFLADELIRRQAIAMLLVAGLGLTEETP